jgi:hypothetical protein
MTQINVLPAAAGPVARGTGRDTARNGGHGPVLLS